MKNFSRTLDLGKFDCNIVREGARGIRYNFWMWEGKTGLDSCITTLYTKARADHLFSPAGAAELQAEALRALTLVQQTTLANEEQLHAGEMVTVINPELES